MSKNAQAHETKQNKEEVHLFEEEVLYKQGRDDCKQHVPECKAK